MDYVGYDRLIRMGLSEADAGSLLSEALGADRFKASYKAMTGKDWNG